MKGIREAIISHLRIKYSIFSECCSPMAKHSVIVSQCLLNSTVSQLNLSREKEAGFSVTHLEGVFFFTMSQ